MRAKDLSAKEAPMCENSKTDTAAPKRAIPKRARAEPKRAKLLMDNEAPTCILSNTEIEDPRRELPIIDNADPKRAKDLNDKELPNSVPSFGFAMAWSYKPMISSTPPPSAPPTSYFVCRRHFGIARALNVTEVVGNSPLIGAGLIAN
jgi:hypothetical protein